MFVKNLWRGLITMAFMAILIVNQANAESLYTHGPNFSLSFSPGGGAQVGQDVNIHIKVDSANPGATKINVSCGGVSKGETSEVEFDSTWRTGDCPGGNANVNVCTKAPDDPNWQDPNCADFGYSLSAIQQQPQPTNPPQPQQPSHGPSIQLSFDPGGGATVGQDVNIHIKVDSNNPGGTKLSIDCGNLSKYETSEREFDSTWRTSACSAGSINIGVCSKSADDPNWQNPTCNWYTYSLSASQPNNPPPAERNPNDYFHNGDLIKTQSDGRVYVIIQEGSAIQRRWIPNPDTLDALGMAQSNVDNMGFSERELKKLGQGSDIPDVNRDPNGFNTFKATFFPDLAPIVHDQNSQQDVPDNQYIPNIPDGLTVQEIPNGPQGLGNEGCPASKAMLTVGGYGFIAGTDLNLRPGAGVHNDPILPMSAYSPIKIIDGPKCRQEVRWYFVEYNGIQGWAAEVGTGGEYHMYPAVTVQPVNTQESVQPTEPTQVPQVESYTERVVPLVEAPTEVPSESDSNWWCDTLNLFCDFEVSAGEFPRSPRKPFDDRNTEFVQCTEYVQRIRPDALCWLENPADGNKWAFQLKPNEAEYLGITHDDTPKVGDIAVWEENCSSINNHVGIVVSDSDGRCTNSQVAVADANHGKDGKIYDGKNYTCYSVNPSCMEFIHQSTKQLNVNTCQVTTTVTQTVDKCSQYKWPKSWFCKMGWIK